MKTIIVKNNEFQTIGFEVTASAKTLFSWGISPCLKSNFQKEINVNDWMTEIFELVKLTAKEQEKSQFVRNFFDVAHKNGIVKSGQSVSFEEHDKELKAINQKIENIIKNII